ncbi:hypothetical protein ZWY2020_021948 [Hordeum vulgare]|nr:hypothetical protein ZWY2020_021948 [Hordeum vulgare]
MPCLLRTRGAAGWGVGVPDARRAGRSASCPVVPRSWRASARSLPRAAAPRFSWRAAWPWPRRLERSRPRLALRVAPAALLLSSLADLTGLLVNGDAAAARSSCRAPGPRGQGPGSWALHLGRGA